MATKSIISKKEKDTINLGSALAKKCKPGDIICLFGELGSGKTTLVKGIAKGMKIDLESVHSPTFVLMNIYESKVPIYHFDLYRLNSEDEIASIGYDEFLYGEGVAVVEWADKLKSFAPKECLKITLSHRKDKGRDIKIKAVGKRYERFI